MAMLPGSIAMLFIKPRNVADGLTLDILEDEDGELLTIHGLEKL